MVDLLIPLCVYIAIMALLCLALSRLRFIKIQLNWALAAILLFSGYFLFPHILSFLFPLEDLFKPLTWPWPNKLLAVSFSLLSLIAIYFYKTNFKISDAGFTLKQKPNSLIPALKMLLLLLACRFVFSSLFGGDDGSTDPEELIFLATMPGLEKETFYRGILLYVMSQAIISARYPIYGTNVNVAGLLSVLLFAFVNGLVWQYSQWSIFYISIIFSTVYGFALLWLREKTGSLLFPILAHNSTVFLGQLL
jgi:membrane protease YdiL (CAAX protease family)